MDEKIEDISEVASETEIKPEEVEKNLESIKSSRRFPIPLKILLPVLLLIAFVIVVILLNPFKNLGTISNKPTPTPTKAAPTATPTPGYNSWKTYKNEEYGFEFKYPPKGVILEEKENSEGECGKAIKETVNEISIDNFYTIQVFDWTGTIDDYLLKKGAKDQYDFTEIKDSNADEAVKVGDIKAGKEIVSVGYPPLMYIPAIYKYNDKLFVITQVQNGRNIGGCLHPSLVDVAKYQDLKNEKWDVTKTFKFLEPSPNNTSNWKTYTNKEMNYSIKYPADWTVKTNNYPNTKSITTELNRQSDNKTIVISAFKDNYNNKPGQNNFIIDGINAYRLSSRNGINGPFEQLIFNKGDLYYEVLMFLNNDNLTSDLSMFNSILSTFKFLDQNQVSDTCIDKNSNAKLSFTEGYQIAQKSVCVQSGKLLQNHICNENTGTWWIDLTPNKPKSGCNPACVVDVNTKKAEVNWRCTGLIVPTK